MKNQGRTLLQKDGTKTVLASLLSIVIGLAVGSILVLVVGLFSDNLGMVSAWEGIRLIFSASSTPDGTRRAASPGASTPKASATCSSVQPR